MPTVRGIMRRGITVTSLVEFMLEQGPSKNANLMTWDKFWALNRKRIDKIVPRYTAIESKERFVAQIVDTDEQYFEPFETPFHAKNPALGNKKVLRAKEVLLEKIDIQSL